MSFTKRHSGSFVTAITKKGNRMKSKLMKSLPVLLLLAFTVAGYGQQSVTTAKWTGATQWTAASADLLFPALPYSNNALDPAIDPLTVEIHYDRHHRAYYNNFIKAISGTDMAKEPIESLFARISELPVSIRNNGGGFYNHVLYWENMKPGGGGEPSGKLADAIVEQFGSYKAFTEQFNDAAKTRFGSGWAWLAADPKTHQLFIASTANQDNPLMNTEQKNGVPLLALDVWEHAYYLKYQNKRVDYITAFWSVVNWDEVSRRYEAFLGKN